MASLKHINSLIHSTVRITNPKPAKASFIRRYGEVVSYDPGSNLFEVEFVSPLDNPKIIKFDECEFTVCDTIHGTSFNNPTINIEENDPVNHPLHYANGKYEVIDFIESRDTFMKDFRVGNAIKYISRAGRKETSEEAEDIRKALWYLKRKKEHIRGTAMMIPIDMYLEDKGMKDTLKGLAIELLDRDQIDLAIQALDIYLRRIESKVEK